VALGSGAASGVGPVSATGSRSSRVKLLAD